MLRSKALLSWHLFVDCPYCSEIIDLADIDEDEWVSIPIFNNKWDDLEGAEVECYNCNKFFTIDKIEY